MSYRFKRPFRYHPHGYDWDRARHSRMLCWSQLANWWWWWWRRASKRLAKIVFCDQQSILECLTLSRNELHTASWSCPRFSKICFAANHFDNTLFINCRVMPTLPTLGEVFVRLNRYFDCVFLEEEVRRKMNFTYLLVLAVLTDVVKVFPVSSSSFARKTRREEPSTKSLGGGGGAWRSRKTKWDLKLSLPSPTYLIRNLFI